MTEVDFKTRSFENTVSKKGHSIPTSWTFIQNFHHTPTNTTYPLLLFFYIQVLCLLLTASFSFSGSSLSWLFWLLTLNSCLNPWIYMLFNPELLKILMFCRRRWVIVQENDGRYKCYTNRNFGNSKRRPEIASNQKLVKSVFQNLRSINFSSTRFQKHQGEDENEEGIAGSDQQARDHSDHLEIRRLVWRQRHRDLFPTQQRRRKQRVQDESLLEFQLVTQVPQSQRDGCSNRKR